MCVGRQKLFFVYQWPICSPFEMCTDRSFVLFLFESAYFYLRIHSAFCQTRSFETRIGMLGRFCGTNLIMYLDKMFLWTIYHSFCPNGVDNFLLTEKLFPKVFESIAKTKAPQHYFFIDSCFSLEKYPEWKFWSHTTRPVSTFKWRIVENAKTRPFCHRKRTNTSWKCLFRMGKSFGVRIWWYVPLNLEYTCFHVENIEKIEKLLRTIFMGQNTHE